MSPKKTHPRETTTFSLDHGTRTQLNALAELRKTNRSQLVREALVSLFARYEREART